MNTCWGVIRNANSNLSLSQPLTPHARTRAQHPNNSKSRALPNLFRLKFTPHQVEKLMRGAHGSANGAAAAEMCASTHFHNYSKLCHHHSRLPADTQIAPALYLLQTPERERRMAKLRTRAPRINALLLLLLLCGCGCVWLRLRILPNRNIEFSPAFSSSTEPSFMVAGLMLE